MPDLLIGIDAGTSVIKAIAFDLTGNQVAAAAVPNRVETLPGGGGVQDVARTWTDTVQVLRDLGTKVDKLSERTAAISVTGQGDGTWLIDAAGDPVGPAWLWLDARAGGTAAQLRAQPGEVERYRLAGTGVMTGQMGPQLRWMLDHAPDMLAGATTSFHCKDWLYFKLTGIRATDPSEAVFSFGDFRTRQYSDTVIDALGLRSLRGLMPPIVDGTRVSHPLDAEAAELVGLRAGTPVVLAYVDVVCTALGAGLYDLETDACCSIIGSTGAHLRLARTADDVHLNDRQTGFTMCFPAPGVYLQMQSNMAATLNVDWILSIAGDVLKCFGLAPSRGDLLARVESWVADAGATPLLYHPYISEAGERGPFVDVKARASFIGLDSGHGFGDLVKAVLGGLALAARDCFTAMGPLPQRIRISGGAARSVAVRRMLGAALRAETQTLSREEAGAAGAAMIAAVATGVYPSMEACAAEWVTPNLRPVQPFDAALADQFEAAYPVYRAAREALAPVWDMLAALREFRK